MWTIYFYADNLKVSTNVSIIFFFEKWFKFCVKLALKLRICVRFASTFNVERVAVLTYDLVICKDSNDCLGFQGLFPMNKHEIWSNFVHFGIYFNRSCV